MAGRYRGVAGASFIAVMVAGAMAHAGDAPPFWTYQDFADGKIPEPYTIRKDHPRLFITPESKKEIVEKIKAAPKLWQRVIRDAERGKGEPSVLSCGAIYQLGLVRGFKYAMSREQYGKKGAAALMKFDYAGPKLHYGERILGLPCGYDWLYDLLSGAQKMELAQRMTKAAPKVTPINCPDGAGIIMGLAFYGDGVDDAAAKKIVESHFKGIWWATGHKAFRGEGGNILTNLLCQEGGGCDEGPGYFNRNWPFFGAVAAWKTATGQDYFKHMGYFRNAPYWLTHRGYAIPSEGVNGAYKNLAVFHYYSGGVAGWVPGQDTIMAAASGYLKECDPAGASLARWWLGRKRNDVSCPLVYSLLIGDPRAKPVPPSRLGVPKTLVMKGQNIVHMRSAWNDPDATLVCFANARYRTRSSGSNAFSLWKNGGALFIYRGATVHHHYWRGAGGWGVNNVIFYEGEKRIATGHSGGRPAGEYLKMERNTLEVASEPGEYDFMRGRCPKVFGVKQLERTLVYLRPVARGKSDHVVVLDRIDSGSTSKRPHVVFNTVHEPGIGKSFEGEDRDKAVLEGQWAFDGAPCVVVTDTHRYDYQIAKGKRWGEQAHARAFLKTLYPRAIRTLKIGGEKHFMDGIDGKNGDLRRFTSFIERDDRNGRIIKGGFWRFHVIPTAKGGRHTVLTAIEAADSKVEKPGTMELLESSGILGAQAGSNIVLFSKDGRTLSSGSVKAAASGTVRVVVCDLTPGAAHSLSVGRKRIRLKATDAGTILAKGITVKAGDVIRVGR